MTKKLKTVIGASLLALGAQAATAEEVTFMGWVGLFEFQKPGWENIVTSFEKAHPEHTVNYVGTPNENTLSQAIIAINGGSAPDIVQVNPAWVSQLNGLGALADLAQVLPAETLGNISESYRNAMTYDDGLKAVPWIPGPIVMAYNRTLMEEAGLDPDAPPASWEDFAAAVDAICALGEHNGGPVYGVSLRTAQQVATGLWAIPMIWAQGGEVTGPEGVDFTLPEALSTFEWYRDTIQSGCAPEFFDVQQTRNVFSQGRAGFIFEGPWVKGLVNNLSDGAMTVAPDGDVWVANMPSSDGDVPRNLDNSNMLVVTNSGAENPAATAFIDFIISDPAAVEYFYETSLQLTSGRSDLLSSGAMADDPYVQAFVDAMQYANPLPIRDIQASTMLDKLAPAVQAVIQGADTIPTISDAQRSISRLRD